MVVCFAVIVQSDSSESLSRLDSTKVSVYAQTKKRV